MGEEVGMWDGPRLGGALGEEDGASVGRALGVTLGFMRFWALALKRSGASFARTCFKLVGALCARPQTAGYAIDRQNPLNLKLVGALC